MTQVAIKHSTVLADTKEIAEALSQMNNDSKLAQILSHVAMRWNHMTKASYKVTIDLFVDALDDKGRKWILDLAADIRRKVG